MLHRSIRYHDLFAIQKKGVAFFRKHFLGKKLFALKSAFGNPEVQAIPYIYENNHEICLDYWRLDYDWGVCDVAGLFPEVKED